MFGSLVRASVGPESEMAQEDRKLLHSFGPPGPAQEVGIQNSTTGAMKKDAGVRMAKSAVIKRSQWGTGLWARRNSPKGQANEGKGPEEGYKLRGAGRFSG